MSDNNLENHTPDAEQQSGSPVTIIATAFIMLCVLSLIEWADMTGSKVKNFNLFADIVPSDSTIDTQAEYNEFLDEALAELAEEDSTAVAAGYAQLPKDSTAKAKTGNATSDTTVTVAAVYLTDVADKASVVDGQVVIEDYSPDQSGLAHLRQALADRTTRPARIAVMGDSYIEGDILTQDLRRLMQDTYGGRGVGYLAANSKVAGFRQTVNMRSSGWTEHSIKDASRSPYLTISGDYYTGGVGATISLKGTKDTKLKAWNTSRILFIAPADGTITLKNDEGEHTFDIQASEQVQHLVLDGETSTFDVKNNVPGLIFLGAWLGDADGIMVDNMSVRGDSGITRSKTSTSLASQMREYVDYDLIILEFGINALSANQTDFSTYGKQMLRVVERVKECYPGADILVMGIGDRGQKVNGTPHSYASAKYMVDAQRNVAKSAGVMFWDTRQAMGGEDAIVRWRENKLANADYIHLNHKGGAALAQSLFNSLQLMINQ